MAALRGGRVKGGPLIHGIDDTRQRAMGQMQIHRGRRAAPVAQQTLNVIQAHTRFQQMGRKAMTTM